LSSALAIDGGDPVRRELLPYGRQTIEIDDVDAVTEALQSAFLTTGPRVREFEEAFAAVVGAEHAVAVNSGTAALHAIMATLDIGPGDEVIVPAITFAATSNAVLYQRGTPVFCDVDSRTLLVGAADIEPHITPRTRAVIAVDYAGQPCAYDDLHALCQSRGITVLSDACHALGALEGTRSVGTLAEMSAFSLHPVKSMTTGEGGVISTNDAKLAARMRRFRNHGLDSDHRERSRRDSWMYEMVELGFNYRLTDVACALGISQLKRVGEWVSRRNAIAKDYDRAFAAMPGVTPLDLRPGVRHAYHLYVVRFDPAAFKVDRAQLFKALRAEGIGVNVHYIPVYLHPYYRDTLGFKAGRCPKAEGAYEQILSLPMFPTMQDHDVRDVVAAIRKVTDAYRVGAQAGRSS